jgi:hypothetical protein
MIGGVAFYEGYVPFAFKNLTNFYSLNSFKNNSGEIYGNIVGSDLKYLRI